MIAKDAEAAAAAAAYLIAATTAFLFSYRSQKQKTQIDYLCNAYLQSVVKMKKMRLCQGIK